MFDFLKSRKERHGITVYLIFGSIILVFAFWGVKTVDAPQAGYAAEVNHEIVTVGEFKRALDRQMNFYNQFMGGQFTPKGEQLVKMKEGVLESLIGNKLISQAADSSGFKATDVEVREQVYAYPAFQQNGRFDRQIYKVVLEQNRLSPSEFENSLRESARLNLARSVMSSVFRPTEPEVKKLYAIQNTKMNLDFLKAGPSEIGAKDHELTAFLKDPEGQKKITETYEKNKATKYTRDEEVRASHILIKTTPGKEDEAQKKILEIAERAKKEDFGELAAQLSEDEGSKRTKGDLGFFGKGRMVEEFETAAFSLAPGKISAPVKTQFGFHIIKVHEKRKGYVQPLDEVRGSIALELINEEKSAKFFGELEALAKEGKLDELNKFATKNNLKWENTGLFDLSASTVPKMGVMPELAEVASTLTKAKPLANRLLRRGNTAYVVRLKELQEPKANPTEKDLETVSQQVANSRLGEVLESWQQNLTGSSSIRRNELVLQEF